MTFAEQVWRHRSTLLKFAYTRTGIEGARAVQSFMEPRRVRIVVRQHDRFGDTPRLIFRNQLADEAGNVRLRIRRVEKVAAAVSRYSIIGR